MRKLLAICLLGFFSSVSAQTVQTTPNLITSTWTGVATGTLPTGCGSNGSGGCAGGPGALYDTATNSINFSYGQATASQTFAINQALANAGAGIQVKGYNYSWEINNLNRDNRQPSTDTLTATILTYAANNTTVRRTDSWTYNTKFDWTTFSGTVNYINPAAPSEFGNMTVSFSGKDTGYWGGYFGPQVRNVNIGLNYGVDPCATNPAYSTTCANYNTVSTQTLWSGVTGPQAVAINQALSGSGVMVHGFDYGYNYSVGGRFCSWMDFLGGCLGTWIYPSASMTTELTNNTGTVGYTETNTHAAGAVGTFSKQLRLNASVPISTMGTFSMTPSVSNGAVINNINASVVYTADPCVTNPLSSTSCAGYQQAYTDQQCASNPLYSTQCAGYTAAYQTQQCTINPLYSPQCAGYASAYLTQQCTANPLYSTTCAGYEQANHDQQCSTNPLYATDCAGYAQAYHNQQCSINPLYATTCAGYDQAYLDSQCIRDSLYSKLCTGYATAYAIKYLVPVENSSAVNQVLSNTAAAQVTPKVDSVETVTATPSTTSTTSVTSVTSVVAPQQNAVSPTSPVAQSAPPPPPPPPQGAKEEPKPSGPPNTRQALAERRQEAAKQEAIAKGKDLAKNVGNAKSMEDQVATQGLVAAAMGYNPAFSAYQGGFVPDANNFYKPYTVYGNQKNVENRSTSRMFGGSEVKHQDMVNSQYNLGK